MLRSVSLPLALAVSVVASFAAAEPGREAQRRQAHGGHCARERGERQQERAAKVPLRGAGEPVMMHEELKQVALATRASKEPDHLVPGEETFVPEEESVRPGTVVAQPRQQQ